MPIYIVSYDLVKNRDYKALYGALKSYQTYAFALESVCLIDTEQTIDEVQNFILRHVDQDDKVLIAQLAGTVAWQKLEPEIADWLHETFGPAG